tara:strand:- start:579 stop:1016 length:438 start_codon:yes stop_codon:yes gene_type:complete
MISPHDKVHLRLHVILIYFHCSKNAIALISILNEYCSETKGIIMPRKKNEGPTRQLFAKISEEIYLHAKAKSAESRMSMREILEESLELYLGKNPSGASAPMNPQTAQESIWQDEYLNRQADRPVGSPIELSEEEAKEIARKAFL